MSTDLVRYTPSPKAFDLVLKNGSFFIANAAKHFEEVRRIYAASAKVRRTLKHQPQTEPNSADEVLA
jgi:hypothetical protein